MALNSVLCKGEDVMEKVHDGCFAIDEKMPCKPADITIRHWVLPNTFQRAEREEAAARILYFSQQLDRWVGVSLASLGEVMKAEYKDHMALEVVQHRNWVAQCEYEAALVKYHTLCFLTLGFYYLLAKKPAEPVEETCDIELPLSAMFVFGPQHVIDGINELIKNGMLQQKIESRDDKTYEVFSPTSKLVRRIMEVQGIVTS